MREHRDVITCAVATANGFAMPYRTRQAVGPADSEMATQGLETPVTRGPSRGGVLRTLARGPRDAKSWRRRRLLGA
jgi:hypothetical protein